LVPGRWHHRTGLVPRHSGHRPEVIQARKATDPLKCASGGSLAYQRNRTTDLPTSASHWLRAQARAIGRDCSPIAAGSVITVRQHAGYGRAGASGTAAWPVRYGPGRGRARAALGVLAGLTAPRGGSGRGGAVAARPGTPVVPAWRASGVGDPVPADGRRRRQPGLSCERAGQAGVRLAAICSRTATVWVYCSAVRPAMIFSRRLVRSRMASSAAWPSCVS